jgi:PAS domain S-box-containing protein
MPRRIRGNARHRRSGVQQFSASIRQATYWLWIALLASVYFSAARISLLLAIPPGYATAVWPPSGIALAAVLMLGTRYWPGIWIGAALVNVTVETSFPAAALIATGNTLEALVGAALIRRSIGIPYAFERGEDVVKFVAIAVLSPTIAASVALIPLSLGHALPWSQVFWNWWTWWQGDTAGIIIVAPLILSWSVRPTIVWSPGRRIEAACFTLLLLATAWLTFGSGSPDAIPYPVTFLIAPFVIWAAFRFSQREVATATAGVCALAVWYTIEKRGPFASFSLNESLLLLLAFASTIVATGLVLSAVLGERKRAAEHRLSESEERFRLMILSVTDYAILMLDPQGRIISWNEGAERIKGYRAEEILGQHFSRFYPDDDALRGEPHSALDAARTNGRFEVEGWRVRKNGTTFWANVVITAVRDAKGTLLGFSKVVRDLTERKRAESELMGAKALAEKASQAKSEFLAKMSHELRTPLNSLMILARLLADNVERNLTAKQVHYAQVIHEAGKDLLALISDVLDLAKIESGTVAALDIGRVSFVELRDYLERTFGQVARDAGLTFAVTLEEGLADAIETDPKRLQQILRNLLSNAFKFTKRGGVSLRIGLAQSGWTPGHAYLDSGGRVAAFSVSDTGIGIPENKQAVIFEPFRQADGNTSREFGGTGLGLSICRELGQRLGGEILVRSTPGTGSTFTLYLPLIYRREHT